MRLIKIILILFTFTFFLLFLYQNSLVLATPLTLRLDLFGTWPFSTAGEVVETVPAAVAPGAAVVAPGAALVPPVVAVAPVAGSAVVPTIGAEGAVVVPPVVRTPGRLYWETTTVPLYFVIVAAFGLGIVFAALFFILGHVQNCLNNVRKTRKIKTLERELEQNKTEAAQLLVEKDRRIEELESATRRELPVPLPEEQPA